MSNGYEEMIIEPEYFIREKEEVKEIAERIGGTRKEQERRTKAEEMEEAYQEYVKEKPILNNQIREIMQKQDPEAIMLKVGADKFLGMMQAFKII